MTLSASLIIRNEASEIAACLDTLIGVSEIVVVDTGSVDNTIAVIDQWIADHPKQRVRLAFFSWCDDFSRARNFAAAICRSEWILTIDADMRLAPGALPKLRKAMESCPPAIRSLALWQVSQVGGVRNRRVLCHRPGVLWQGAIHEALDHDSGATADEVEIHYGWSDSHSYDPARNLRILLAQAGENPTHARTLYYLGAEYWDKACLDDAADAFHRCLQHSAWLPERADALLYLAKIRWLQSRGDEARRHCLDAIAHAPECREAMLQMATMSHPEQARTWARLADHVDNTGILFVRSPRPTTPAESVVS